jgi:hypothetical protein
MTEACLADYRFDIETEASCLPKAVWEARNQIRR